MRGKGIESGRCIKKDQKEDCFTKILIILRPPTLLGLVPTSEIEERRERDDLKGAPIQFLLDPLLFSKEQSLPSFSFPDSNNHKLNICVQPSFVSVLDPIDLSIFPRGESR